MLVTLYSFFSPTVLRVPSTDHPEICHLIGICVYFIMQVQKLGGGTPQKNFGAKNMQNFGRFWTTSDFDCEYLRNG